jgi:PST family polysaccharide transporter
VVLQLVTSVILARLLTPEDFGLIAMVTALTNFAAVFGELGLSAALIQREDLREGTARRRSG